MKVIDFEDRMWYLLEHDDKRFIDVNCNHSAFGFSILINLNGKEEKSYLERGHSYLNELATDFSYYALTKYKERDESRHYKTLVSKAIKSWKETKK
ncbi:hypothetical protein [Labilibaculum sp.]|uniref:hypothetical protein n=1 Tax=Labilibaculum sp. TaxID=2060723 RepID=UPI002AA7F474|nr:hypothetical protein [Labilibaculum sp.]